MAEDAVPPGFMTKVLVAVLTMLYWPKRVKPPTAVEISTGQSVPAVKPCDARVTVTSVLPSVVVNAGTAPPSVTDPAAVVAAVAKAAHIAKIPHLSIRTPARLKSQRVSSA